MKGLIKKINESEYILLSQKAIYCFLIATFISFITFFFYLKSYDTQYLSFSPSPKRTIFPEDPNMEKVKILKSIEEAISLTSIKSEIQKYSNLDDQNLYPFVASLEYFLKRSISSKKTNTLLVKNRSLLRESFNVYENFYNKKDFNDLRTFEHKLKLDTFPKIYHTQSIVNRYLHLIYLKCFEPLEQFFHLYLTIDVSNEETFDQRLEKILVSLDNLYSDDNFYSVRTADLLYTRLNAIVETSPYANLKTVRKYKERLDQVNSQFAALEHYWPMRVFYREIHRNHTDMSSLLSLDFRADINTKNSASFMVLLFYCLTPVIILLLLGYSVLALYRWRLTYTDIKTDTYTLSKKEYLKALIFGAFLSLISFFIVPMFNTSHLAFLYQTLTLLIIFINCIYYVPMFWLSTKLAQKAPLDSTKAKEVFLNSKYTNYKVQVYIISLVIANLVGNDDFIIFVSSLIFCLEGIVLFLLFFKYMISLNEKKYSKWYLSNLRLYLNFTSFSILILVTLTMLFLPTVQKYFVVNDEVFHYEIKDGQIQSRAYSTFIKNFKEVKKGNYEKFEETSKGGTAYTIEIAPEIESTEK